MQGKNAEVIVPYKVLKKSLEHVLKNLAARKVAIAPNEEISHTVNLKYIYNLKSNKEYRVKSYFIPDFSTKSLIISTNELYFKINKQSSAASHSGIINTSKRYVPVRKLSPKEVILLTLNAEKHRMPFAKYLNIQRFIFSYPKYYHLYLKAGYNHKIQIEKDFITFLYRDRYDYILDFNITKENIKNNKIAYVEVIVDRFGIKRTNRYRYRYTLTRKNIHEPFWLITHVNAYVLKGVKR